jgi:uncharacterized phage-associated protein
MERTKAVANFFIKKALDEGREMTLMKLIKLAYISHGWYLGITGESLLPEQVQAWQYGPVVPGIYQDFKRHGDKSIFELEYDVETSSYPMVSNPDVIAFLDKIWEVYGALNALQLSSLTHQIDTPWDKIWNKGHGKDIKSVPIPNDALKLYYQNKANLNVAAGR